MRMCGCGKPAVTHTPEHFCQGCAVEFWSNALSYAKDAVPEPSAEEKEEAVGDLMRMADVLLEDGLSTALRNEIVHLYKAGNFSIRELAYRYGVSSPIINYVIRKSGDRRTRVRIPSNI